VRIAAAGLAERNVRDHPGSAGTILLTVGAAQVTSILECGGSQKSPPAASPTKIVTSSASEDHAAWWVQL
jgi:hypothetical protein